MKILIAALVGLVFTVTSLAQRASESVTTQSVSLVTRLVSITPVYSGDTNVVLLAIQENFITFTRLPGGVEVNKTQFSRQWTSDSIVALPSVWTNRVGTVITNNTYKNALSSLWTRFDAHPELTVLADKNPGILYVPTTPAE